ncbi:MAG: hypothetical protein JXB18_04625 [Sedimentisphaerales bacterium]|nr:hypothetical protein [Sedimentisphaerales bacterium]
MNSNPCPEHKTDIEAYCCGHLSPAQAAALQEHLSGCSPCSRYHDILSQQDKRLTAWADSLDSRIQAGQDSLLQRLRDKKINPAPTAQPWRYRFIWQAAAAVVLIASGFFAARLFQPAISKEQLFAEWSQIIQPQMEQKLADAVARQLRPELLQMRNDLANQMTTQINEASAQSVALSQAMNAKLIREFADAVQTAQSRDRLVVSDALLRLEEKRLQDKKQTQKAVTSLALATGEEIARTRRQLFKASPMLLDASNTNQ